MAAIDNFRENLKAVLAEKGVTPGALAGRLHTSRSYIGRILQGEAEPTVSKAEAIAHALGVPYISLYLSPADFAASLHSEHHVPA